MGILHWWRSFRSRRLTEVSTATGHYWEQQAESFLMQQGLQVMYRNYHCPAGEIDLIMKSGDDMIVFVEVRYRKHHQWANALESVTKSKQKKVIKAAQHLMTKKKWHNRYHARFDVVAIQGDRQSPQIDWIEHAFY